MTIWEAMLLGLVEGVFMFFPISSTSHLVYVQHWLIARGSAMPSPDSPAMIAFDLFLHLSTIAALAIVYGRPFARFLQRLGRERRALRERAQPPRQAYAWRLVALVLVSTLATGAVGFAFKASLERTFAYPLLLSVTLAITGILLVWSDRLQPRRLGPRHLTWPAAAVIGLAQGLALIPGISRGGSTMIAGLFVGLKRRWAAEYSFLIAVPTILGATALQVGMILRSGEGMQLMWEPMVAGLVVATVSGIGSLYLTVRLLRRAQMRYFAYYAWAVALLVAISVRQGWL